MSRTVSAVANYNADVSDLDAMSSSTAAPKGLRQTAGRLAANEEAYQQGRTMLRPWAPEASMLETAKQWYSGQNAAGEGNGWDTKFYDQTFYWLDRKAAEAGETGRQSAFFGMFDDPTNEVTGVALWDSPNTGPDGQPLYRFGDIFVKGEKQEGQNLYDVFDRQTADVMMGELLLDGPEKAGRFARRDMQAYGQRIEQLRAENSQKAAAATQVEAYQDEIVAKQRELADGFGENLLVAGGVAGGVVTGAGIGTVFAPGVGTVIGGAIGGVVSGIGAWLNQDELTYMTARAQVISQRANERWSGLDQVAASGFAAKEYAAVATKLISPLQNLAHGIEDERMGDVGDFEVEWAAVTPDGRRQTSNWMKALDLTAAIGDGVMQFLNPVARAAYMTSMGVSAVGKAASIGTDYGFDDRKGGFQELDDGDTAAAMGSALIDLAQAVTPYALVNTSRKANAYANLGKDATEEAATNAVTQAYNRTLHSWSRGQQRVAEKVEQARQKAADALPGERLKRWAEPSKNPDTDVVLGGMRFRLNDDGTRSLVGVTKEVVAPSTFVQWIPQGFYANSLRRAAGRGTVTADDMFNAAVRMNTSSTWRVALLNAYAEGAEEAVQGVLDPMTFDARIDPWEVAEQAAYGAAGGLGMGLGTRMPQQGALIEARARELYAMRSGRDQVSDEEWSQVKPKSRYEMKRMAKGTPQEDEQLRVAQEIVAEGFRQQEQRSAVADAIGRKASQTAWEKLLANQNRVGGDALTAFGAEAEYVRLPDGTIERARYSANTAGMSIDQVMMSLSKNSDALAQHVKFFEEQKRTAEEIIQANADPDAVEKAEAQKAQADAALQDLAEANRMRRLLLGSEQKQGWLWSVYSEYLQFQDAAREFRRRVQQAETTAQAQQASAQLQAALDAAEEAIDRFNEMIQDAYDGKLDPKALQLSQPLTPQQAEAAKMLVELLLPRHPLMDTGSYNSFVPQASKGLSRMNAHGAVYVHQATLKTMGADHDGDNFVQAFEMYLPPEARRTLRRGLQYVKQVNEQPWETTNSVPFELADTKWKVQIDVPDSEADYVRDFGHPGLDPDERDIVLNGLQWIEHKFMSRYANDPKIGGPLDTKKLLLALKRFREQVLAQNPDARVNLVETLFGLNADGLFVMSDEGNVPEVLQMWSMVSDGFARMNHNLARWRFAHRPSVDEVPGGMDPTPARPDDKMNMKARVRAIAGTIGDMVASLGAATPVRASQKLHYSVFMQAVTDLTAADETGLQNVHLHQDALVRAYALLGSDKTESDAAAMQNRNSVQNRVLQWMNEFVALADTSNMQLPPGFRKSEVMLLLSQVRVPDLQWDDRFESYIPSPDGKDITLLQLLLSRSLDIEENIHSKSPEDSQTRLRIKNLRRLTRSEGENSKTAALCLAEVFGDMPAEDLVGEDAYHLGSAGMTVRQFVKKMAAMDGDSRSHEFNKVQRTPAYLNHTGIPDAPYSISLLTSRQQRLLDDNEVPLINGFTLLVKAAKTQVNSDVRARLDRADTVKKNFKEGFHQFRRALQEWRTVRKDDLAGKSDAEVFRHFVKFRPDAARAIAEIIPDAAALGVLDPQTMTVQQWVEDVFLMDNVEEAVARYHLFSKLAEWNVMRGTADPRKLLAGFDENGQWSEADVQEMTLDAMRGRVNPRRIQSRFLETVYLLAVRKDGGFELMRFLRTCVEAKSVEAMYERINAEPVWLAGRAPLHPFADSVDQFELNASDVFNAGSADLELGEAALKFTTTMDSIVEGLSSTRQTQRDNAALLNKMDELLSDIERKADELFKSAQATGNAISKEEAWAEARREFETDNTFMYVNLLELSIMNRTIFLDIIGPEARDKYMASLHEMIQRMHDKGKAPEEVRALGEAMVNDAQFGFGNATRLEGNALTSRSWREVQASPSLLCRGPVRVMMDDGVAVILDLSTPRKALNMLLNPATQEFAKAVLFPTTRDINSQGNIQLYLDAKNPADIGQMLENAAFSELFRGDLSDVNTAYRYIGYVEAHVRNAVLQDSVGKTAKETEDDLGRAYYPIQNMIDSILVAYQTTVGRGRSQEEQAQIRNKVVVQVAQALRDVGTLSDPKLLLRLEAQLSARLQQIFWQDSTSMQHFLNSVPEDVKEYYKEQFRLMHLRELMDEQLELRAQKDALSARGVPNTDPAVLLLVQQVEEATQAIKAASASKDFLIDPLSHRDFESVWRMFAMSHKPAPEDYEADLYKKAALVAYLGSHDRINNFEAAKESFPVVEADVGQQGRESYKQSFPALIDKFRYTVDKFPEEALRDIDQWSGLMPEEWDQLALWATQTLISERTIHRGSSSRSMAITLGVGLDELRKLHDSSWSNLASPLFDPRVYAAARTIVQYSGYQEEPTPEAIVDSLVGGLYNTEYLGAWHDRIPINTHKAKKLLDQASVGPAIAADGNNPKDLTPWVASGRYTYKVPTEPEYFSQTVLQVPKDGRLETALSDELVLKLHGHFVSDMTLVYVDDAGAEQQVNLKGTAAAGLDIVDDEVQSSGFGICNLNQLNSVIRLLQESTPAIGNGYRVEVTFVDVDKKPFSREWANNIYFDGVGRNNDAFSTGLIAAMFFSLGAISKEGQQLPLDALTKAGRAFRSYIATNYETVQQMELAGKSVRDVINAKAMHMMRAMYPNSRLQFDDLPALYKYLKTRHVVVGLNVNTGKKEVMWAEEYISKEEAGVDPGLVSLDGNGGKPSLVSLSEEVSAALLGGSGWETISGDTQRPELNISTVNVFPQLTLERLESLGLDRLGEIETDFAKTQVAQFTPLRRARGLSKKNTQKLQTQLEKRKRYWQKQTEAEFAKRGSNTSALDTQRLNDLARERMRQWLGVEDMADMLEGMGVIPPHMTDVQERARAWATYSRITQAMSPNAVMWVHQQGVAYSDPSAGVLSEVNVREDFNQTYPPTYGDVVQLDLQSFLDANKGDEVLALQDAQEVVKAYAQRGLMIFLGAPTMRSDLRMALAEWITESISFYQPVNRTTHFFEPVTSNEQVTATLDAQESELLSQRVDTGKNMTLTFLSRDNLYTNESATIVDTKRSKQWARALITLVPTNFLMGVSGNRAYAFSRPTRTGRKVTQFDHIRDELLKLDNPEGRAELLRRMGDYPRDYKIFERYGDGRYRPGVRGKEEALDRLFDALKANEDPLTPGREVMTGDLYITVTEGGSLLINRVGFKMPDGSDRMRVLDDWKTPIPGSDLKLSFTGTQIENLVSVLPPTLIKKVEPDHRDGISIIGEFDLNWNQKDLDDSFKATRVPKNPDEPDYFVPVSRYDQETADSEEKNNTWITAEQSLIGNESKGNMEGAVLDFANLFAVTGVDFSPYLVEYFENIGAVDRSLSFTEKWNLVKNFLEVYAQENNWLSASEASRMLDTRSDLLEMFGQVNAVGRSTFGKLWKDMLPTSEYAYTTPSERIAEIILVTLATPGTKPSMVVKQSGLLTLRNAQTTDAQIKWLPELMSKAFDDPRYPELRKELLNLANAVFARFTNENGEEEPAYTVDSRFNFWVTERQTNADGQTRYQRRRGVLKLAHPAPADENTVTLSFRTGKSSAISAHNARNAYAALGAVITHSPDKRDKDGVVLPNAVDEYYGDNQIMRFRDDSDTVWDMMTSVLPPGDYDVVGKYMTPLEAVHVRETNAKFVRYHQPLNFEKWEKSSPEGIEKARVAVNELLEAMNLHPQLDRVEVDYLVRQWHGKPAPTQEQQQRGENPDDINPELYTEAVRAMLDNLRNGMHPLHGAMVPFPSQTFWRKLFMAQEGRADQWAPRKKGSTQANYNWDEWCNILIGQVLTSTQNFNAIFARDVDGFWRSFQNATPELATMSFSIDPDFAARLLDPETNEPYVTLDAGVNALLQEPAILSSMYSSWATLAGHEPTYNSDTIPASERAKLNNQQKAWMAKNGLDNQVKMSMMDYAKAGSQYRDSLRDTSNFMRGLYHMSIGNRLINPALWVSATIEVPMRNQLENLTNLLTGSDISWKGKKIAQFKEFVNAKSSSGEALSLRFTVDDFELIHRIAAQLGTSDEFLAELFSEMNYKHFISPNGTVTEEGIIEATGGKYSRAMERYAEFGAKYFNDPSLGMRKHSMALRYLGSALETMELSGDIISLETLAQNLEQDPLWLKKNYPKGEFNPHIAGVNTVAQIRSQKATVLGKMLMKPVDYLSSRENTFANIVGWGLKIPLAFTRFNANALMTLTGIIAVDEMAAMVLHGRRTPRSLLRMNRAARAKTGEEVQPEYMDFSDVIETMDFGRIVLRGGISQAGLLLAGMVGASLGLGGEDEEERRRRRMTEYLGLPMYYDMRKAQNDFTWSDAIFLDSVPILGNYFRDETGRSAIVPSWILKQFTAPVMGVTRFFETGDLSAISHGFMEAIAVIPNSILGVFRNADMTAAMLAQEQDQAGNDVTEAKRQQQVWFLASIAGIYERALVESQWVNGVLSAFDEYDRNPWLEPLKKDGEIVRELGTNLPLPTDALKGYQDENRIDPNTGKVIEGQDRVGYQQRSFSSAMLHQYAENNATAAMVLSLVTGQWHTDSSYLRWNMVGKTQKVNIQQTDQDYAEALVLARYMGSGGQEFMTKEEIMYGLKFREESANRRWNQADIEAEANALYKTMSSRDFALSIVDPEVGEMLTVKGGKGILKSLYSGAVDFSHPSMQGVSMSQELRDKIAEEWQDELVQEGMNWGLSEQSAKFRMRRLWFGDDAEASRPGLRELLYSKQIPSKPTAEWNQLNTTYKIGPDGQMWATPFGRNTVMGALLGLPLPNRIKPPAEGTTLDERGNVVDKLTGINTGFKAIVPKPLEDDIKPNDEIIEKTEKKSYTKTTYARGGYYRFGYGRSFRRGGYGRGGYGGGGGGSSAFFQRLGSLRAKYGPDMGVMQNVNTGSPIIRRADVRRERFASERGRLKQWQ